MGWLNMIKSGIIPDIYGLYSLDETPMVSQDHF